MTHIIAICNQKGGVGKTTLTINLGAALANLGQQVLLIDLDPQGHLTEGVGLKELYLNDGPNLCDSLVENKAPLADLIHVHPKESFAVIPSSYHMMLAEQALYMSRNREHKLKGLLSQLDQLDKHFDWVLIDCPPTLGNLTDNALNAARHVVIPIQAEATSVRALELLFDQIESVERGLNIHIHVLAVVPNLVQDSNMATRTLTDLRQAISVLTPFEIRKRVQLQDAWSRGCSIFAYKTDTSVQTRIKEELMTIYRELAEFVREQTQGEKHE